MWWLIPLVLLLSLGLLVPLVRAISASRDRTRRWNDLRQRSRLIASQLQHLRDVTSQRNNQQ
jgi:hypothetical protein